MWNYVLFCLMLCLLEEMDLRCDKGLGVGWKSVNGVFVHVTEKDWVKESNTECHIHRERSLGEDWWSDVNTQTAEHRAHRRGKSLYPDKVVFKMRWSSAYGEIKRLCSSPTRVSQVGAFEWVLGAAGRVKSSSKPLDETLTLSERWFNHSLVYSSCLEQTSISSGAPCGQ